MNEIYVTGHRNPDTDSIVAALSYAALKNALGEKEYVAVHMGTISDETNRVLKRFGFKPPRLTYFSVLPRTSITASWATGAPALSTF